MSRDETAGVVAPPPLIVGAALIAGLLVGRTAAARPLERRLGELAICGGLMLGAWGVAAVKRAGSNVDPYASTTSLVTAGPYRYSRNPMYLGLAGVSLGVALRAPSPLALALLPPALAVLERGVVDREERYLEARFGDEYRTYRERVPRWF
jgi:protein-S-isoprenylcysteine O-methyltransferase Ste14